MVALPELKPLATSDAVAENTAVADPVALRTMFAAAVPVNAAVAAPVKFATIRPKAVPVKTAEVFAERFLPRIIDAVPEKIAVASNLEARKPDCCGQSHDEGYALPKGKPAF